MEGPTIVKARCCLIEERARGSKSCPPAEDRRLDGCSCIRKRTTKITPIDRGTAKDALPDQNSNPIRDALWDREPVQYIPHIIQKQEHIWKSPSKTSS